MVALIVPWRPGCSHRELAWAQLKARHQETHPEWPIIEGTSSDGPWCKADAVADALTRTDDDLIVVHDADVWTDGLHDAVEVIDDTTRWAVPHGKVYRLAQGQLDTSTDRHHLTQPAYEGYAGGGIVVIDRAAYEACPLDPRFQGWGQEDSSAALALTCLFGAPWRGDAPLWHWWHPPQDRQNRITGSRESAGLYKRYRAARGDRTRMLRLLEEAHQWQPSGSS